MLKMAAATSMARLFHSGSFWNPIRRRLPASSSSTITYATATTSPKNNKKKKQQQQKLNVGVGGAAADSKLAAAKRRTRSDRELDREQVERYGDGGSHIPVMLGEVLEVFASSATPLRSFVDCTLGSAGHSSAIIQAHPELQLYIGLDVDPLAHEKARARINSFLHCDSSRPISHLKAHILLKNFRNIKTVIAEVNDQRLTSGVDGILMDLGMSSMQVDNAARGFSVLCNGPLDMRMDPQATLKAEDILNSWPDTEVERILREYGEESNWHALRNKIIKARLGGGLHSTGELVELIRSTTPRPRAGGRQGWIKTATRVFQALRIAVNDELRTLEDSLYACFDCLAPGGRLAVISFHSLEDRIVKQTFLNIINSGRRDEQEGAEETSRRDMMKNGSSDEEKETWIKQMILGWNGIILTKRPITPSEEEERLNRRCRSAKLRVIQKVRL
ncbi:uncharacterized protein LOC131151591 isoform X2 [Malania oleifera]|uniref:uncharacterized protein LOC131151591 isoform X2 n=1 Tax=Malania oleifera TaxID=397392 RepID=UPI0025AEC68C|nr:uncharacterized protein LOC131151591 isoform X2 [Malania oleifera]